MQPAVLVRLRPAGPWRYGPGDGGHNRVDALFRSDRLFSCFTLAAQQLGWLEEWLNATARSSLPAVTASSLFPFQGDTLFAPPPATLWPPPQWLVTSPTPVFLHKVRWNMARFAPVQLIESILLGQKILADQWIADPESECLLRRDRPSTTPFRTVLRTAAAVDRVTGRSAQAHTQACVEFETGAGLWFAIRFRDENAGSEWSSRVRALIRLVGDSGFGGRRSAGWGQTQTPEVQEGQWPQLLFPKLARSRQKESEAHWLLSLFSPAEADSIDWAKGDYSLIERGAANRKRARFVAEGSVLESGAPPIGAAVDTSDGGAHAVYRSGIALSLTLPVIEPETEASEPEPEQESLPEAVEQPSDADTPEQKPCVNPPPDPVNETQPDPEVFPMEEPAPDLFPPREPTREMPPPDMPSLEMPRPDEPTPETFSLSEPVPEPLPTPEEPESQQENRDAV